MKDYDPSKLVDAPTLLEILFDERSRPTVRWLRKMQADGTIPFIKIGHLVRFEVDEVRKSLRKKGRKTL